jgi:hypothetical protein
MADEAGASVTVVEIDDRTRRMWEAVGISNALHPALEAACQPDFAERLGQIERTKGCAEPIWQRGGNQMVLASTGEVVHAYSSEQEVGGRVAIPCGNRRRSRCPSCSNLYRGDQFHVCWAAKVALRRLPSIPACSPPSPRPALRQCITGWSTTKAVCSPATVTV